MCSMRLRRLAWVELHRAGGVRPRHFKFLRTGSDGDNGDDEDTDEDDDGTDEWMPVRRPRATGRARQGVNTAGARKRSRFGLTSDAWHRSRLLLLPLPPRAPRTMRAHLPLVGGALAGKNDRAHAAVRAA